MEQTEKAQEFKEKMEALIKEYGIGLMPVTTIRGNQVISEIVMVPQKPDPKIIV